MLRSVSAASSLQSSAFNTTGQCGTAPQLRLRHDDDGVCFSGRFDPTPPNRRRNDKRDETLLKQLLPWVFKLGLPLMLATALLAKGCEMMQPGKKTLEDALTQPGLVQPNK